VVEVEEEAAGLEQREDRLVERLMRLGRKIVHDARRDDDLCGIQPERADLHHVAHDVANLAAEAIAREVAHPLGHVDPRAARGWKCFQQGPEIRPGSGAEVDDVRDLRVRGRDERGGEAPWLAQRLVEHVVSGPSLRVVV